MASLGCRLIHPQSPLQTLVVEPVREGRFAIYHGLNEFYAIYQRCVSKRCLPDFALMAQGAAHILTGLALHAPLVNAVVFQIFISHTGSYRERLRDAVDREEPEAVKCYLDLGVSPNNVYDTKPLLFRTRHAETIERLINAGADLNRTYSGMSFLEHLLDFGLEDLAATYFDRFHRNPNLYTDAINKQNWALAAFLVRRGEPSLLGREKIVTRPQTDNPLELPVIRGDAEALYTFSKSRSTAQVKKWVKDLSKAFPAMKVSWVWTAILSARCWSQESVDDRIIVSLFECGAFHEDVAPLDFEKKDFVLWAFTQGREALLYRLMRKGLFKVDSSDLEAFLGASENNPGALGFAVRLGYRNQRSYDCITNNPLEGIVATQNAKRLETFAESYSFKEFYDHYLGLKAAFPGIYTGWMWNILYEIPQSHFEQYTPIQEEEAIKGGAPAAYPTQDVLTFYDRINFYDPSLPHYVERDACKETLDGSSKTHTPQEVRKGFSNIFQAIQTGRQSYRLSCKEQAAYRLQLEWIVYYLHQGNAGGAKDPLPRDQANVLIDIGKSCLMCPGRYNDIFDIAIRRLSGKEMPVVSFEDQLQRYFADLRIRTLNHIVHTEANNCTHAWDNLVFHLHDERALPNRRPEGVFSSQIFDHRETESIKFTLKTKAIEAFDAAYLPEEMMGMVSEFARVDRKRNQEENDFNELMMEAMINAYSTEFPAIQDLEVKLQSRALTLEAMERNFRDIDPFYTIPKAEGYEQLTFTEHFANFKRAFLGPKVRPLDKETYGYALPEVIHPLVMGKVLCDLRHLRQRITFASTA